MLIPYRVYVCVVVLCTCGVSCYRSGHNAESPPHLESDPKPANNYFKINYFYPSLPNQNTYAEIMRAKDPPSVQFPMYHWKVLKSGISEQKRTVGTEFLGKRSEIVEDIDFDDPNLLKSCNQKNCVDK